MNLPENGELALKADSPLMKFKEESLKLDGKSILVETGDRC
jgi:hypothetical protein